MDGCVLNAAIALPLDHDARFVKLELAIDCRLVPGIDAGEQLRALLARLRCRALPDRTWWQPAGLACYDLASRLRAVNRCACVRTDGSKVAGIVSPVAHVELRFRGRWLDELWLDDPLALLVLTAGRIAVVHRLLFDLLPAGRPVARARARLVCPEARASFGRAAAECPATNLSELS